MAAMPLLGQVAHMRRKKIRNMGKNWKEVNFKGKFKFSLPTSLSEADEQGIDSSVALWEGKGITVRVDYGLFSDPLTSYVDRPNYNLSNEDIGGHAARIVWFDQNDGSHFVAAHFHDLAERRGVNLRNLTIVVETSQEVGSEIPEKIIRSIQFQGGTQ
jgi:hypothetical protein